jgi:2-polyprenyl-3-methyl-5-hydroxy-6-metoxy-1,4-benzoquinol methylase
MKYYVAEHEAGYERIEREGGTQWNDLFEDDRTGRFEDFPTREFLQRVLPGLPLPTPRETRVLEYGCGTGSAACFLAAMGFQVDAIDLIPRAIELARSFARERGVAVRFGVQDVCDLAGSTPGKPYDLILDSYCLQSIVTDADRARTFAAVRSRLKPTGYYLVSTAMYEARRTYDPSFRYDDRTGICYQAVRENDHAPERRVGGLDNDDPDTVRIGGTAYRPHRRHLRPQALRDELTRAGFRVLSQTGAFGGDVVCVRANA